MHLFMNPSNIYYHLRYHSMKFWTKRKWRLIGTFSVNSIMIWNINETNTISQIYKVLRLKVWVWKFLGDGNPKSRVNWRHTGNPYSPLSSVVISSSRLLVNGISSSSHMKAVGGCSSPFPKINLFSSVHNMDSLSATRPMPPLPLGPGW